MYSPSGECSGEAARWSVAGVSVGATVATSEALAAMVRAAQESEAKLVTHAVVNAPPSCGISVNGHRVAQLTPALDQAIPLYQYHSGALSSLVPLHSLIPAVEQVNASANEKDAKEGIPKGKKQQPVTVSVIGKREPLKARQAFSQCPETWRARAANTAGAFI